MFAYFFLQLLVFIHGKRWDYLGYSNGLLVSARNDGICSLPDAAFLLQLPEAKYPADQNSCSNLTMLGVILNRLNVTVIGFRWDAAVHYVPSWMEIVVTLTVIFTEIWIFRWVINRMPVLRESPSWVDKEK